MSDKPACAVWHDPEAGGEEYVPLAIASRARSHEIWRAASDKPTCAVCQQPMRRHRGYLACPTCDLMQLD